MRLTNYLVLFVLAAAIAGSCINKKKGAGNAKGVEPTDSVKIDSLTRLIDKNTQNASLYAERSKLLAKKGKLPDAIKDLIIANNIDSLNPEYYIELADFYLGLGKSGMVNSILQKGDRLAPGNIEILYRLGNLYFYVQDYKKALMFLNKAQQIDSYFAEAYFTKGLIYNELNNKPKAIESFQLAVEREPEYYDAYIQLGLLFAEKHDSLALNYYDNALLIIPDSYEALYGKAFFYQTAEQIEKAQDIYSYIIRNIGTNAPAVYFNMGYIEMLYYADFNRAISLFDSSLMAKPDYIEALSNKAFCYEKLGDIPSARKNYKRVLELQPNYTLAVKGMGRLDKQK